MSSTVKQASSPQAGELEAEVARLRRENAELRDRVTSADRRAAVLLEQAQLVADSLLEESVHRVVRMLRAARSEAPYDGVDEILRLSKQAHAELTTATATLARLVERIEAPVPHLDPTPDPLSDRVLQQRRGT